MDSQQFDKFIDLLEEQNPELYAKYHASLFDVSNTLDAADGLDDVLGCVEELAGHFEDIQDRLKEALESDQLHDEVDRLLNDMDQGASQTLKSGQTITRPTGYLNINGLFNEIKNLINGG